MKKLILAFMICFLIAGCKSEGGSSEPVVSIPVDESQTGNTYDKNSGTNIVNPNGFTEEQIRADWNIPPAPTPDHPDYNTIKGVDDYGISGARDDWEITNAIATYPDKREFDLLNKGAVNNSQMIEAYEAGDDVRLKELFEEYIWISSCFSYYYYEDNNNKRLLFTPGEDTTDRSDYELTISIKVESLFEDGISSPTRAERREKCPAFITQ